ncbi:marine proteobacterial sortase target protein [Aestuariirhabdus sp. Z084]|uniref:marine proteobacterial sortase target protein n=1 Tax=Aestuariirhabdus haliotis TaxID=2918751 RepID=UPI00201B3576|nr:marine proteobacterial sortase target protein [Aestuariirhabdus haliotis]MCL6415262.1 marine proteobacterial sortase target protein [Aestuariirhabdus haliotis]MCL6419522.1 marine proteobacterial sortase target protein [Aestuariirhabdus haliotis]
MNTQRQSSLQDALLITLALILQVALVQYSQAATHPVSPSADEAPLQAAVLMLKRNNLPSEPAPQLDSRAHLQVNTNLARVTLSQQFLNPGSNWAEALYQFPLPDQATVDRLRIVIGERVIEGEIQEKNQAKATYAKARAAGKAAGLVERHRPNLFSSKVANIPPGAKIRVEISYLQPVTYDSGHYSLLMPMTLTPRYIPGKVLAQQPAADTQPGWSAATDQVPDATEITPFQIKDNGLSQRIAIAIDLNAGMPLAELTSPSHPLRVQRNNNQYQIGLAAGKVAMDRDFVLRWTPAAGQQPSASVLVEKHSLTPSSAESSNPETQDKSTNNDNATTASHPNNGDYYALLQLLPPVEQPVNASPLTREQIFIIDTSGSMSGTSIQQAREALKQALGRLDKNDYFNIIEFNSHSRALYSQPMQASLFSVAEALRFVDKLVANGGTEIAPALATAFQQARSNADTSQVIFITDGSVGNEKALLAQIERQRDKRRLFTVAIGTAPNHFFMRQAARLGQGSYTRIGDIAEVSQQMKALLNKLDAPQLSEIEIRWPKGAEHCPEQAPDLFASEPLTLLCRLDNLQGTVEVQGRRGNRQWLQRVPLQNLSQDAEGIAKLWASEQIQQLEDQQLGQQDTSTLRQQILKLALDYQLVSQYTSLIAVERTPIRPETEGLDAHRIPNLMPAGSRMSAFPQTATDSPLLLALGGLLMALACLLLLMPRLRRLPCSA